MSQIYQIAIDGPAGSGKSTLAKGVAKKLGIMYLDTGAMYRTCAVAAIKAGVDPKDNDSVSKLIESMKLEVKFIDGVQHMILNGEDVTAILRTPDVSKAASDISALPVVRTSMVNMQRDIENKERELLRNWVLKECFPKELKALEIIKESANNFKKNTKKIKKYKQHFSQLTNY